MSARTLAWAIASLVVSSTAFAGAAAPATTPPASTPPASTPPATGSPAPANPAPDLTPQAPVPNRPPERHGLFGGGALWAGNISCNGTNCGGFRAAGGGSGHIGWMFTPRFGAMLDVWGMTSKQNNLALTFVTVTIDARYWIAPVFWIQGGVGNGHAVISALGLAARGDDVPVGQIAAGYEIVRGHSWALDLSLQLAQGTSTNSQNGSTTGRSVGVGAHITWFAMR